MWTKNYFNMLARVRNQSKDTASGLGIDLFSVRSPSLDSIL